MTARACAHYMAVFNTEQVQALALLLFKVNDHGAAIALVFFGFYAILKGFLIVGSTFLPRALGVLTVDLEMKPPIRIIMAWLGIAAVACSPPARQSADQANAGIDSLNARIVQAYRTHDPKAYAALYTDTAVFEWPAFNTVHGAAGLAAMARDNWVGLRGMDLRLTVASRRVAGDHGTEFGAFEQSWSDSAGTRNTEFGRYVVFLLRQADGSWRMDRFFGFEDSTRPRPVSERSLGH